uniref:Ig-like domain-containing protein n=1 Tax=Anabas testudineus TaxID=64144 RepID=A0A7N5ZUH9_ANATE
VKLFCIFIKRRVIFIIPVNTTMILVEWTRPDLLSPEYIFLYRDGSSYTSFQHPSFVGRVELKDKQMKDVSLILRNVSSLDGGVYECRVSRGGEGREKRANIKTEPVRVICLEVEESGELLTLWLFSIILLLFRYIIKMQQEQKRLNLKWILENKPKNTAPSCSSNTHMKWKKK